MLLFLCRLLASYVQTSDHTQPTGTGFIALKAGWNRMAADGCIRMKAVGCIARTRVRSIVTERRGGYWCSGEGRGLMEVELKELAGARSERVLAFSSNHQTPSSLNLTSCLPPLLRQLPPHHHSAPPLAAMSDSEERETKPFKFVTSELPLLHRCTAP